MAEQAKENKLEHPCFPQPNDTSAKVWRYLDLAKFIWLLENRKLYLPRLDLLNDPHEGSTPRLLAEVRDKEFSELTNGKVPQEMSRINQQSRKSIYVNCWNLGNAESEAMWRLYCPGGQGVAIQTTYAELVQSINRDPFLYVGVVTYIDYESQWFPLGNMFYSVMHKRISFAHEHEVRLVKTLSEYWGTNADTGPLGVFIDWDTENTINSIYINPYAPDYYQDVVRTVVRRTAPLLESRIHWSQIRGAPVY